MKEKEIVGKELPKYFRPSSDVGFKKIYATEGNESELIKLLNSIIDDKDITEVTLLNPVHAINNDTTAVFDVYCKCEDGSRIIVEMQNRGGAKNFVNRALAYTALIILDQAYPRWQYRYEKVYFIGILNYIQFPERKDAFTKVGLCTIDEQHTLVNENYLQIYVELPKLAVKADGTTPFAELYLCAMRDIGKVQDRPKEYQDKGLDDLYRMSMMANFSPEETENYTTEMGTEVDYQEYVEVCEKRAREEGRAIGVAEGEARGEARGKAEIARKMLSRGLDAASISELTGLSLEQIDALTAQI